METPTYNLLPLLALVLLLSSSSSSSSSSISSESVIHTSEQDLTTGDNNNGGKKETWCIAKPTIPSKKLSQNIEYCCKQSGVNCTAIKPGGDCFHPNTLPSHASYTMNLYYKAAGKHPWDCHFDGTAMIVITDPSSGSCNYPV